MASKLDEMDSNLEDSILYTQLQPWSISGALPCMEPISGPTVPPRVGELFKVTHPHPWRPILAYEMVEIKNMPEQPLTNQFVLPCCQPDKMVTEALNFPNLITGFERNPQHAARAALYTRYTGEQWENNNATQVSEADMNRNLSERLRNDTVRLMRETDERTAQGQLNTGKRLGERITDITFWRSELSAELDKLIEESSAVGEIKQRCAKAMLDLEAPLHIAQECLFHRETRKGIELVHDEVERSLMMEIQNLRDSQIRLRELHDKVGTIARDCRSAQQLLEEDVVHKESTLGIDTICHNLNNYSRGIAYYGGIERIDNTISSQREWAAATSARVSRSQAERAKLAQLRTDTEVLVNAIANSVWDYWSHTNNAFDSRAQEMAEAKIKVQMQLQFLQQEIIDLEKNIFLLRKAIDDKSSPMMVAQTRIEARNHREGFELCKDYAQLSVLQEVEDIKDCVVKLHSKLIEAEAHHQNLVKIRSTLEVDLRNKTNALYIDREKCMGLRRSFPVDTLIKY